MKVPVFKHTIEKISAALQDENQSLQSISALIKYDPGLYLSFLMRIASSQFRGEVTTISQIASLIGSNAIEHEILNLDHRLDDEQSLKLWYSAVLAGEAAILINDKRPVAESEEAFFAALLPSLGMLLLLEDRTDYHLLLPLVMQLSVEDRVFLEDRLFKKNHISILDESFPMPKIYKDILGLIKTELFPSSMKSEDEVQPARLSAAHISSQLYHLSIAAEYLAQSVLFPKVVMAQENLKQLLKRFFGIVEGETEELISEVIDRFESVCREFGVYEPASDLIRNAGAVQESAIRFLTTSAPLLRTLNEIFSENQKEKNILIWGEAGVGKRLLAFALHNHPDNPRRSKPFISLHCDTSERDALEEDLFGAAGGYWGTEKHKGAFDMANGGTIMLKNIDRMPSALQDRLAEIVSRIDFFRSRHLKGSYPDVVFILTSRKDLWEEAREERFSKALLRALDPIRIYIPPLRERRDDIGMIADGIIKKYQLPMTDTISLLSLQEFYDSYAFKENLSDLKRLLFYAAAKKLLKS